MSNNVFYQILNEKVEQLRTAFSNTSNLIFRDLDNKLFHPGEFGSLREDICKEICQMFTPKPFEISDGFIIDDNEHVSNQCDIVVYDTQYTPKIESSNKMRFFPIETISAVGEVKSTLSKEKFVEALKKLSALKKIREKITPSQILRPRYEAGSKIEYKGHTLSNGYNPEKFEYQQITTFLICQKLDFNVEEIVDQFDAIYGEECPAKFRHNLILSFEDGLMSYFESFDKNKNSIDLRAFPEIKQRKLQNHLLRPNNNGHIYNFLHYYYNQIINSTILLPNINRYLPKEPGGYNGVVESTELLNG